MAFQVRDLMLSVFPEMAKSGGAECQCRYDSTIGNTCGDPCPPPSCQQSCPQASQKGPKIGREMLSVLRDQMRQALVPA